MSSFKKLNELVVGEKFEGRLVLTEATIKKTKSTPPRPYLACTFADATGNISGNIWNYPDPTPPTTGLVCDVTALVGEYQGKKQFNNIEMSASFDQSKYEFSIQYCSDTELQHATEHLTAWANSIKNERVFAFVEELFLDRLPDWAAATAATGIHHVGRGGLIMHTLEVVCFAANLQQECVDRGYDASRALVIAGALLHDIGKIDTYYIDGPACYITLDGVLHDHIVLGIQAIAQSEAAKRYPNIAGLLTHIISSHHGKVEYGSPVPPRMVEAEIVARADGLSASLDIYQQALDKANTEGRPGDLTERVYAVSNSQLIRRGYINAALYDDE